jgi:hypothetical protein
LVLGRKTIAAVTIPNMAIRNIDVIAQAIDADRLAEHVLNDLVDDGLPPPSDEPRPDPSLQV